MDTADYIAALANRVLTDHVFGCGHCVFCACDATIDNENQWVQHTADVLRQRAEADIQELADLITAFKKLPGCDMGGPIHIITDDSNLEDHWIEAEPDRYNKRIFEFEPVRRWVITDEIEWSPEIIAASEEILTRLRALPEPLRHQAVNRHWETWND